VEEEKELRRRKSGQLVMNAVAGAKQGRGMLLEMISECSVPLVQILLVCMMNVRCIPRSSSGSHFRFSLFSVCVSESYASCK